MSDFRRIKSAGTVTGWMRLEKLCRSTTVHDFATPSADSRLKMSSHCIELSRRSLRWFMIHRIWLKCSSKLVPTHCRHN